MSNKTSMLRKFMPGTPKREKPPVPRSKDELNKAYTAACQQLGNNEVVYKQTKEALLNEISRLGNEANARAEIDKAATPSIPNITKETKDGTTQTDANKA